MGVRVSTSDLFKLLLAIPGFSLLLCGNPSSIVDGGSSTEIPNGAIAATIIRNDSTPAARATVKLRPAGYLTDTPEPNLQKRAASTTNVTTDADGRFVIDSVSPGEYRIEVTDRDSTAVLLTFGVDETVDSVVDLGTAVLRRFATLSGVVHSTESLPSVTVGVYGLERRVAVDAATGVWRIADLPAGDFRLRIEPGSDEYGAAVIDAPYVSAGDSALLDTTVLMSYADEDYAAWAHSHSIRINTTASGADVTDDVYNFPLLVRLDTTAINFAQTAPDGRDIRFSKSDGTPLRYEIDFWDADSGHAAAWVLMDTVRGNDSTQSITMHWGGPADAPDFSSPSAVFNTANGHAMVWHVNETPARDLSVIHDATVNAVDGDASELTTPARPAGVIGTAMLLGNPTGDANDTVGMLDSRTNAIAFPENPFTISWWTRKSLHEAIGLVGMNTPGYGFEPTRINHHFLHVTNVESRSMTMSVRHVQDLSVWNLFAVVVDRSNGVITFCVNDTLIQTDDTRIEALGSLKTEGLYCLYGSAYEVDEIRIDHTIRSAGWIKLSYETQRRDSPVLLFR